MLQAVCSFCWTHAPLPLRLRRGARDFLFRRCGWAFCRLPAYRRWTLLQPETHRHRVVTEHSFTDVPAVDPATAATVRAIAMHLPQFHRIPENDRWWGEGFSEWTNVRRGRPFYEGHQQPHVPHADIGYYDLSDAGVLERQASMARAHGIHGFCFYYYWFNGRRLLEKPLDEMLRTGRPDFPFCVCWANENWTRNWDGLDSDVLIASRETADDDLGFIRDLLPLLRDPRYIRVEGRPLVVVYRVGNLRQPARTAETWRRICREEGIGEIHLCCVWSFDTQDPRRIGFDSAMQFPPLLVPGENLAAADPAGNEAAGLRTAQGFEGAILDYRRAMRWCLRDLPAGFTVFRGVMPSWDNTARRMERGTSWINATPQAYGRWLREAVARTCFEQPPERRLLFINAWNEWAEGAYLEPDERLGYRRLAETKSALAGRPVAERSPRIAATAAELTCRLEESERNVLVDLLFAQPGFHGGGEYGKAVFRALVDHASRTAGLRVWAAFDPDTFMEPWVTDLCREADVPVVRVGSFQDIASLVDIGRFDAFFTPGLVAYTGLFDRSTAGRGPRRTRIVGTVHDIIEVTLGDRLAADERRGDGSGITREDYDRLFSCDRIDAFVTVSEHSRGEIIDAFGPPAADLFVLTPPEKVALPAEPFAIDGRAVDEIDFALIVNAGRPEKNAAAAVRAFDHLFSSPDHAAAVGDLRVVVGGIDAIRDLDVGRLRHPGRFIAVPHLPGMHYEFLLERSRFLVYPSLEEGFGYPPVEAMRYGTPAVVARVGAVREVCADAAVYCDPDDDASIAAAIMRMVSRPIAR
ncbi:MAG: glycosyltransferase, partial [Planctomycetia bacterium]|nr:glycosyltransferase [Planctomycetia bacterium]